MSDVTRILQSIEAGDLNASEQLLPLVYEGLRNLAARKLALEKPGQTLQATALVHEAYLRLVGSEETADNEPWQGRGHFYSAAAEAMRRILVDNARRKKSRKHGGEHQKVDIAVSRLVAPRPPEQLIALSDALDRLNAQMPAIAELVKLRYFGGLSINEAAEILEISPRTADRYWAYARAWLHDSIASDDDATA